jgi:hypothetical protein
LGRSGTIRKVKAQINPSFFYYPQAGGVIPLAEKISIVPEFHLAAVILNGGKLAVIQPVEYCNVSQKIEISHLSLLGLSLKPAMTIAKKQYPIDEYNAKYFGA